MGESTYSKHLNVYILTTTTYFVSLKLVLTQCDDNNISMYK